MDNRTGNIIRALIGFGTCALLAGYCQLRSMDSSDLHARFGLPDVPPSHGTDEPLDSARLEHVLADPAAMKAAVPMGQGVDSGAWRDLGRLSWIWSSVKDAPGETDAEWIRAAQAEIAERVRALRSWPIPGVSGPAVEIERLNGITEAELALLATHRTRITRYFEVFYASDLQEKYLTLKPGDPEAAEWLRHPDYESGLAGNRFDSAEEGAEFVDALYAAGAVKVVIASEQIQQEGPDERYADALRVVLPDDAKKRADLFRIVNREAVAQGYDAEADTGQPLLFLWWD